MDDTAMFEPDMLGKDDTLPQTVTLPQFTAARGKEVQIMKKTLGSSMIYTNKLAFQKLPRYMRRRAMSHNVKRLPRRLREIHKNQITKSGLPQKTKRPSRKYVRRPYNLNSDYMRRRRRVYWLDTHIWHAKRFFMTEKWGCKIPFKPCDRSFKACYRATRNHCLLQDISYYKCIELKGDYSGIVEKFKRLINSKNGLTIGAKTYESGKREGTIYLYKFGSNNECIGKVNFLWKPIEVKHKRTLWLWLHPALYSKALETIVLCFDLKTCLDIDAENLTEMYFNDEFELTDITSELSRFRLTGPLATAVLQKCFVPFEETIDECIDWIGDYKEKHEFDFSNNLEVWNDLSHVSTFSQIPPHIVLSLIIRDPRFNLPKTRTKALPGYENFPEFHYDNSKDINKSPLWSNTVRAAVKHAKITNHKVIELRQDILVPGTDLESKGLPIPILLIQRPGCKNIDTPGYGSGWDVILPGGWAQPTWISLIMFGARSGGLQETNTITFEMGQNDSLEPDTEAGAREEADVSEKCREVYFRKPPNKRINFNKFNISSPLCCNWKLLLSEWQSKNVEHFFVLRDKSILKNIQDLLTSKTSTNMLGQCSQNCLIPVKITVTKGQLKKFAIICLPLDNDFKKEPKESKTIDVLQQKRKDLRKEHKQLLKRLRKRRIRAKENGKVIHIDKDMLLNYTKEMRSLWLPEPRTIRKSCSREVIGFVKHGDFSLSLGKSSAVGYIVISALQNILNQKHKNKLLLRNNNSMQYRLGELKIICD